MSRIVVAGSLHHDVIVSAPRLPEIDETLAGSAVRYEPAARRQPGGCGLSPWRPCELHRPDRVRSRRRDHGRLARDGARRLLGPAEGRGATGMSVAILNASGSYGAVIVSAANLAIDAASATFPQDAGFLVLQNEVPEAVNQRLPNGPGRKG